MKCLKTYLVTILLVTLIILLFAACGSKKLYNYYSDKDNYISLTGTVSYINYSEDNDALYLEFDDMSIQLSDNYFKVVGNNLNILHENLNGGKIQIGDSIIFMTAPRYFGDGYVMPIVSATRDDTVLLSFEQGIENLLSWIDSH